MKWLAFFHPTVKYPHVKLLFSRADHKLSYVIGFFTWGLEFTRVEMGDFLSEFSRNCYIPQTTHLDQGNDGIISSQVL